MIIDHRTYTLVHGRMQEYLERYERVALPPGALLLGSDCGRAAPVTLVCRGLSDIGLS